MLTQAGAGQWGLCGEPGLRTGPHVGSLQAGNEGKGVTAEWGAKESGGQTEDEHREEERM